MYAPEFAEALVIPSMNVPSSLKVKSANASGAS